jgi:hypothetical protein
MPQEISLVKIEKISTLLKGPEILKEGHSLENDFLQVTFSDFEKDAASFSVYNKAANKTETIRIGLGYYSSYEDFNHFEDGGQKSGDYIFRPNGTQYQALPYSSLNQSTCSFTDGMITLVFNNPSQDHIHSFENAMITVSLDNDVGAIRANVDMNSLPPVKWLGYEVVALFSIDNFQNNQTFYTDSNGLEMQKRILNFRPTWDLQANYNQSL